MHTILHTIGYPVTMCCDILGVVDSSFKLIKFEPTILHMSKYIEKG